MAVAHRDIDELMRILEFHVPKERLGALLLDLRSSKAAVANNSLFETIDRLMKKRYALMMERGETIKK